MASQLLNSVHWRADLSRYRLKIVVDLGQLRYNLVKNTLLKFIDLNFPLTQNRIFKRAFKFKRYPTALRLKVKPCFNTVGWYTSQYSPSTNNTQNELKLGRELVYNNFKIKFSCVNRL